MIEAVGSLRRYGPWRRLVNAAVALVLGVMAAGASFALPASAAVPRIIAFGDSLTAGYGVAEDQAFPVRLQAWLGAHDIGAEVINAGVSGDTSAGGLARLDWALGDGADAVLVELGANDALRGIDPKVTEANLDQILAKLQARKVKVLLLGMQAPANWGRDYQQQFGAIYPDLAKKYHVPLYPFFLDGVALQPDLVQADGLHPNPRGVEIMVNRVGPYVARLLGADVSDARP
jgi:acyl-CoA thioesterase-1